MCIRDRWEAEVKAASAAAEAQAKAKAQAKRAEEAQTSEEGSGEWTTVAGKRKQWKKREEQPLQKGVVREVSLSSSSSESNTSFPEPLQKGKRMPHHKPIRWWQWTGTMCCK